MIDCSFLPAGRPRCICEGFNADGSEIDMQFSLRVKYLQRFFPEEPVEKIIDHVGGSSSHPKGLGDVVAMGIKRATFGLVKPCGACKKRREWLNRIVPFSDSRSVKPDVFEIEQLKYKSLLMHIWPTKNFAWKWNLDQLSKRIHVFNGHRSIGVATENGTCSFQEVKEYCNSVGIQADFFEVKNNKKIREGSTFLRLLSKVQSLPGVTFYCHAKGSRHLSFGDDTTVKRWTEVMYSLCLDRMRDVECDLMTHCMTGPFKRYGMFKTRGNKRWHYSGSFYWFRNEDVFSRQWNDLDNAFFCVESWPARIFWQEEVACRFLDHAGDLYKIEYWQSTVEKALKKDRYECILK